MKYADNVIACATPCVPYSHMSLAEAMPQQGTRGGTDVVEWELGSTAFGLSVGCSTLALSTKKLVQTQTYWEEIVRDRCVSNNAALFSCLSSGFGSLTCELPVTSSCPLQGFWCTAFCEPSGVVAMRHTTNCHPSTVPAIDSIDSSRAKPSLLPLLRVLRVGPPRPVFDTQESLQA